MRFGVSGNRQLPLNGIKRPVYVIPRISRSGGYIASSPNRSLSSGSNIVDFTVHTINIYVYEI